ncbi:hypothetical protein FRX31_006105 [Thalictrum thalictroides]|uniref:Uncharacterized protein n=1 Tax=Thalictrum thalictroides TaxID=46969 RepID=A0A7J6X5H9_THATH|nr:hypothetical protein FRX31_006105 [Thalictrum thalictroides]
MEDRTTSGIFRYNEYSWLLQGIDSSDAIFKTVSKTGKKTTFWEAEAPVEVKPAEAETKAPTEVVPVL